MLQHEAPFLTYDFLPLVPAASRPPLQRTQKWGTRHKLRLLALKVIKSHNLVS